MCRDSSIYSLMTYLRAMSTYVNSSALFYNLVYMELAHIPVTDLLKW